MTRISEETGHYVEMVGCPCECIEDRALAIHRAIQDAERRPSCWFWEKEARGGSVSETSLTTVPRIPRWCERA